MRIRSETVGLSWCSGSTSRNGWDGRGSIPRGRLQLKILTVLGADGSIDRAATEKNLLAEFPELSTFPIGKMLASVEATLSDIRPNINKRPQYLWLFYLAGRLKSFFAAEEQGNEERALELSPFAWVFADLLRAHNLVGRKDRTDWSDSEAVEIEWLNAWANRKLVVGSSALSDAYEAAAMNPLKLKGNRYFLIIVNMGYLLQRQNDTFPFILPVNATVARMLSTTVPTISAAVAKAIRDNFFIIVEGKFSASARKARLFRFNFDHPTIQCQREDTGIAS